MDVLHISSPDPKDWKLGLIASHVRHMESGRIRDKVIEEFWRSVYNGSQSYEPDFLRMKGWDHAEFLHRIDEIHVESPSRSFQDSTSVGMN
jgi:hypothetical protein